MLKGLKIALSNGVFASARDRVAGFVVGTVKNAVDEILDWLIKHGIRFGVAAAALITALVLVITAAKEGIVALGAPPALVSLGLGLVCALVGYIFLKSGPRRPRKESESEPYPGLSIRISGRPRPVRRRRSRRRTYDVHRGGDGWEVSGRDRSRGRTFSSKSAAVRAAERSAARAHGRVVVRRSDGTVQESEDARG